MIMMNEETTAIRRSKRGRALLIALVVISLTVVVVGIVLIILAVQRNGSTDMKSDQGKSTSQTSTSYCDYSEEATRIGLEAILSRTKKSYYENLPFQLPNDPDVSREKIIDKYTAYNPTPEYIKQVTDAARKLLEDVENMKVDPGRLKTRERKALSQLKHYLKTVFGHPFDMNYYAGDWMMGPTFYCKQPICNVGKHLHDLLIFLKPQNLQDMKVIEDKLETHREGILRYMENLKLGKMHGMVYSVDACISGQNSLKRKFLNINLKNSSGVLDEKYVEDIVDDSYFVGISEEMNATWKRDNDGKSVKQSLKDYLVKYMGDPMQELLRYLEFEHSLYCVPSNVSSGLANLPLDFVWFNGTKNTSWPTTKILPQTTEELSGKKAYSMILKYFTTNEMTPLEVHRLGQEQLNNLYPLAVQAAKSATGKKNESEAIELFKQELNASNNFFNAKAFPANESDKKAEDLCSSIEAAKKYCPKRWEALQNWFKEARMVMSMLYPKIVDMFYFAGDKHSTPNCPINLTPDLNPSSGIQSYDGSDSMCLKATRYNIPFFLDRMGPKFSEWSINSHEARPGHHIQIQGVREHFKDSCGGLIGWLDSKTYYTAFLEGWGLYAENPLISDDTDVYDGEPMKKYGMLKWQIWRAIRMIVDTGLHFTGMKRDEAIQLFVNKAWDDSDFTRKEVTRYQNWPGQSTAYMVGRLGILKARDHATKNLGKNFTLKDFHYQVLSQGSSPLAFLQEHIEKYVDCAKQPSTEGCSIILKPPKRVKPKSERKANKQLYFEANRHYA